MTLKLKLKLLVRVVRRRVGGGEELEAVLKKYPKLTEAEEKAMAREALKQR